MPIWEVSEESLRNEFQYNFFQNIIGTYSEDWGYDDWLLVLSLLLYLKSYSPTMKLKDSVKLEISREALKNVLDILVEHQKGYSVDFASERIYNIRQTIDIFKEKLV